MNLTFDNRNHTQNSAQKQVNLVQIRSFELTLSSERLAVEEFDGSAREAMPVTGRESALLPGNTIISQLVKLQFSKQYELSSYNFDRD
ncbi:hypothetical protein ElyMa_002748800 [Elysia marginata]|uniref:Uncharacterized protein n=1 Tax=Elysia marginata TaxID=1093978 RepID=A0AAV4HIW0_9GAST|nr:hypothetical protein ElyMa_002748800 [Elysia marginata]